MAFYLGSLILFPARAARAAFFADTAHEDELYSVQEPARTRGGGGTYGLATQTVYPDGGAIVGLCATTSMAASAEEEGQIDEEFWAKEDEADERKQLIWDNARPCSWSTQSARPRTGCRRVGDVYWPEAGVSAAAAPESTMSPPKKKKKKTAAEPDAQMKRPADSEPARKEKKMKTS